MVHFHIAGHIYYLYIHLFCFSLLHHPADDGALTRFLQTSLFLVASPILVKSMHFFSVRTSLTLSIQVILCFPLLLFPSTRVHVKSRLVVFSPPSIKYIIFIYLLISEVHDAPPTGLS